MLTLATHSQPFYHLLVIEDRKAKRIVSLEKYVYSLGRHLSNAIIIDDHQVSRHHATLLRLIDETDGHFYKIIDGSLEGTKSRNGVFVNGRPCLSHPLKHGDLIEFGSRAKAFYLVVSQELAFNLVQLGQTAPIDDYASEKEFKITLTSEEDKLHRQEDLVRLASFPELSPNPIIEIDWEGNIIYLNPLASTKFAEIYQTKLKHPLIAGLLDHSLHQQGNLFVREVEVGQEVFEQHIHYLPDSRIIRSYLFNVTEYRQAEAARRESEQRFRNAFASAAIGMCLVSPKGKFLFVNSSVCQILGYSESELLNLTCQEITHPDDRELDESYVQQLLAGEIDHYHLEKRYFDQPGNVIWAKLSVSLVRDADAKPLYLISQIQNITEHKQGQQLPKLNEQLMRSNAELAQFADTASHELREPLRKIKSYSERLGETEDQDQYRTAIVDEVTRMQNLVCDLSVYSQAIATELVVEPTDLNTVLEQVLHSLESLIEKNNAQIIAQPLPTVMAHRSQMTQLFHNLIHNSLKFRSYAAPVIEVSAQQQEEQWLISVTDNGIGINSKYAGRVFEIFQRLHSRNQYEGTGIGLSVCQKIVERYGGKIWLESERGTGTTFYFTLNLKTS